MIQNFNGLTPAETERLAMLSEEAGEIVLIIGKILRHGYQSYHPDDKNKIANKQLLVYELADLMAVTYGMVRSGDFEDVDDGMSNHDLWEKKLKWTHHQK